MPESVLIHSPRQTKWSRTIDSFRRYLTDDPTPERLSSNLKSADQGDFAALVELQMEMEAKDSRLQGIVEARRGSLTALEWRVVPDPDAQDFDAAMEAADFVSDALQRIKTWPDTLEHLATAIGPNVAVVELLWERGELVGTVDVPGHRLLGDIVGRSPHLFMETEEERNGVRIVPGKFVIFHPNRQSSHWYWKTQTHATVRPFIMKHYGISDWLSFSEVHGHPARHIKFDDAIPGDVRKSIHDDVSNAGSDAVIGTTGDVDISYLQAGGTGQVFRDHISEANNEYAILYLGQTLSTDVGDRGSFAAAKVHDNVRADILLSDIQKEARLVREEIFRRMITLKFPGRDMPVPVWERVVVERRNVDSERLDLEQIRMARELGLPIEVDEVYKKLGLKKPEGFDKETIGIAETEADGMGSASQR